jgi:ATP-binding cassette subfamily B protein
MIALVGPTGAGKTTIINLLPRFYEITGGRITIDGCDISELEKDQLRRELGIVLQDAYLFSGTIRDNIAYGKPDVTDEQIQQAAKLANAHSFIRKLSQGYDTPIISGGSNLSQGQRQLLTIARAILADPAILILDEATSSIDTRTEMQIQEAMRTLMKDRTSFVIAHRLSTIREADQILVIDDGKIAERGSHDELMQQQGFYYQLHQGQLS